MSKISTYEVVPVPKLADKLIGTSVGGEIEDITYNFTLQELLDLYIPLMPANNLQGILDYGNTATQDIILYGTIFTTNLEVSNTTTLLNTYLNGGTHIVGGVFDSVDSIGTPGQVLTSNGVGVEWYTLPPIFTPNLQQVLTEGNIADLDIVLSANIQALDGNFDTATINNNISIDGTLTDGVASVGAPNQVLGTTVTGVQWVDLPVYGASSPLLFNPATRIFSIQVANATQNGYLSSTDWITFDGKQPAGPYITALTGEASANGPGSAAITLNNAAVIGKILTGLNITGGSISATDSILTAFGKIQNQINGLVGGVQYQGTWDAATNTPTLQSSVGTQGWYYIVNVAGNTNLNGITDWKVGDWAIFSGGAWSKVDNTESVTSVNGFTGAVSLTTDNIPEGLTNLYFTQARARTSLSFQAGSGAYNNLTGVITIPTDNSQILNGAGYITLGSLSATTPLSYDNLTGVFSIQVASAIQSGYLSATDWSTFNNKQNYLGGTGLVKSVAGTISYITDNSTNWNTAYDNMIVSAAVTGTSTKTLTLTEQDGGTITASWTDLDTGLTSVGVTMPSAFTVTNSPLTSNGTIAVTGAGTTLQYIDGTGALRTFPTLTGYVPYSGATQNVDLGTYGLLADYLQLNTAPTSVPTTVGTMSWNDTDGTMDIKLKGGNVTLQVGEENVTRVVNKSGIDLLEANYQVVRARKVAEGGAAGQRLAVVLAQGNSENNSTEVLGLVTETILANQEGFVTSFGLVNEINTTGSLQGETWVDGDILYLSSTVAGGLTNVRPVAPNHSVTVGYVTYAHAIHGKIYMAIDTGYELGELHNVYAPSPAANASIWWNSSTLRYENNTIAGILGYTPANAATTLTINGTTYDLSANRTWSVGTVTSVAALTLGTAGTDLSSSVANGTTTPVITLNVPTASAANRGALSAADWSTFNTKVGSVTTSGPLASSGGVNPNITIQVANSTQDGYLSSTDWNTFNNKQAAGNYITSLTGEATASGPGAASVTLSNAAVTGKVLTGINITGGTVVATDSILTGFGKLQNQINGLIGSTIYQGTWNASTNTPTLTSSVGTRGWYYIVNVAGTTNLNGITDWQVGDWAIFDGTAWQKVDNTDAVVSVNGQTGAVSLTTDNIPEGSTNLYFTDARARASLSFAAGSGAYNSTSGLITIPTNTNQLTNGAAFITLASLSGTAPIVYSNTTGAISITQAGTASNGYLSSTDWNTFNNKQSALTNPVTASGSWTSNYIPKINGSYTLTNSLLYDGGSSIGVNTNAPYDSTQFKLDVNGGLLVKNTSGTTAQFVLIDANPASGGNAGFVVETVGGTSTTSWAQIQTYYGLSIASGALRLQPSGGQILVGTTTTSAFLVDINGTLRATGQLTLGSTISNGTYTYTLPSATGTLALTSQIPSLTGYVTGTGTQNKLTKWSATASNIIDSYITDAAGTATTITKDGVSTTAALLSINPATGTNASILNLDNSGAGSFYIGRAGSTGGNPLVTVNAYDSVIGHTGSQTLNLITNNLVRFFINGSGTSVFNYGINFQNGSISTSGELAFNSSSPNIYTYGRYGVTANGGRIIFNNGTGANMFFGEIATDIYGFTPGAYNSSPVLTFNLSALNVGIGTAAPTDKLHLYNSTASTVLRLTIENTANNYNTDIAFKSTYGGTSTKAYLIGSNINVGSGSWEIYDVTNPATRFVISSTGNVGIGVNAANTNGSKLFVAGNYFSMFDSSAVRGVSIFASQGASYHAIYSDYTGGGSFFPLAISARQTQSDLYINTNGYIGVGTASPQNLLHVKAGASGVGSYDSRYKMILENNGEAYYYVTVPDNSYAGLRIGNTSAIKAAFEYYMSSDLLHIYSVGDARFYVGGSERMRITSSGLIGIGTTSPATKFEVSGGSGTYNGNTAVANFNSGTTSAVIQLQGSSTTNWFGIDGNGDAYIWANGGSQNYRFAAGGSERMRITSGGRIGINTQGFNSVNQLNVYGAQERVAQFMSAGDSTIIVGGTAADGASSGEQYITYQNNTTNTNAWMVGMDDGEDWRFAYGAQGEITDANSLARISQAGIWSFGTISEYGARVGILSGSYSGLYINQNSNLDSIVSSVTVTSYNHAAFVASLADAASLNGFFYYGQANGVKTYAVYPNGNVQNTNGSYGTLSDVRIKENIIDATPKLENLLKVRVVNYNLIAPYGQEKQIGVVAQELEKIFPSMVYSGMDGIKGVKYSIFTPMIIKAIQEQDETIKAQGLLITELRQEIELLKAK